MEYPISHSRFCYRVDSSKSHRRSMNNVCVPTQWCLRKMKAINGQYSFCVICLSDACIYAATEIQSWHEFNRLDVNANIFRSVLTETALNKINLIEKVSNLLALTLADTKQTTGQTSSSTQTAPRLCHLILCNAL